MRKLALSDEILLQVENPARYIGGEINAVMKNPDQVKIRFAMTFQTSMKSACLIWECRFFIICLINVRMSGARGYFLPGQIWTKL